MMSNSIYKYCKEDTVRIKNKLVAEKSRLADEVSRMQEEISGHILLLKDDLRQLPNYNNKFSI